MGQGKERAGRKQVPHKNVTQKLHTSFFFLHPISQNLVTWLCPSFEGGGQCSLHIGLLCPAKRKGGLLFRGRTSCSCLASSTSCPFIYLKTDKCNKCRFLQKVFLTHQPVPPPSDNLGAPLQRPIILDVCVYHCAYHITS